VFDREWDLVMLGRQDVDQFLKKSLPEANAIVRGDD
jgi:hypothetical protein